MAHKPDVTWADFLTTIRNERSVTLVGPLYDRPHTPLMPTVYVDGGSRARPDGGWKQQRPPARTYPTISVGDGDSAPGALDELLPAQKDYSDLAFVLRSLPTAVGEVEMLGFLGGRRDHELANLGEVHRFLASRSGFARVDLTDTNGDYIVAFREGKVALEIRGLFSVFVLEPAQVQIGGACRYPLENATPFSPLSSHGLSNEGHGVVTIASDGPCFVFLMTQA